MVMFTERERKSLLNGLRFFRGCQTSIKEWFQFNAILNRGELKNEGRDTKHKSKQN